MSPLLTYAEAFDAGPAFAGGKGWNLARLARYGFPVPAGAVLSSDVYRTVLGSGEPARMAAELAATGAEQAATPEMAARLAEMRRAIEAAALPAEVSQAVEQLRGKSWAVRSSASAEDGERVSFAGIHESFLSLREPGEILAAVKRCYASLWTPQALAYRRRWDVPDEQCACAVVLCEMVAPKAAGVAFTCDPRTGRRDILVIEASEGLGDALVRGEVQPATYRFLVDLDRLSIESKPADSAVLSDAEAVELAYLALRVHWALGDGQDPQDIEWAHDGEQFRLLQARPVTRLPRWTFPAVAHAPVHWSNANIRDGLPNALTPMSWSFVQNILEHILYVLPDALGYPIPRGMEVVRRFSGRAYFDLTGLQWVTYDGLGAMPSEVRRDLGGAQPEIEVPPGDPLRGPEGRRRRRARMKMLRIFWNLERRMRPEIDRIFREMLAARRTDWPSADMPALERARQYWRARGLEFGTLFQFGNSAASAWHTVAKMFFDRLDPKGGSLLLARLLAGSGAVTSAEQGYRLYDLSAAAQADPDARRMLESGTIAQHWKELPGSSKFRRAMEVYLEEFGHRSASEGEIANPRWADDQSYLFDQILQICAHPVGVTPRERARRLRMEAEAELNRRTFWLRPPARWLAGRARAAMALREAGKSCLLAVSAPGRQILVELGRRFAANGTLEQWDDVFFLTVLEFECLLRGHWDGAGARVLIADRKAQLRVWQDETPPDAITCAAGEIARPQTAAPAVQLAGGVWTGIAAAPGYAQGTARVMRTPLEGSRLEPGDILVAPSTDPGWTPLFVRAGAIVTEIGGFLSHGAIVAREYGIPAVANLPGIMSRVRDGDRLFVDGNAGRVGLTPSAGSECTPPGA